MKTRAFDPIEAIWRSDYIVMPSGEICMTTAGKDFFVDKSIILVSQPDWKLSRFTGLCDRNGEEIYEGDVLHKNQFVRWARGEGEVYEKLMVVVEWGVSGFVLKRIGKSSKYILDMTKYEIIGNIFQNPELLEGVK